MKSAPKYLQLFALLLCYSSVLTGASQPSLDGLPECFVSIGQDLNRRLSGVQSKFNSSGSQTSGDEAKELIKALAMLQMAEKHLDLVKILLEQTPENAFFGDTGFTGVTGPLGVIGMKGATGAQGVKGKIGNPGTRFRGMVGYTGDTGSAQ